MEVTIKCSYICNVHIKLMMKKKQSTWWRMMQIAVTLPLVGIALTAFSKPKQTIEVVNSSAVISGGESETRKGW